MPGYSLTHLKQLEAESIHIIREVVAEFENPVMLYSIGKDSSVMVRLAEKAFYPAKPPFPLMHVDTTWKFREMYELRDNYVAKELGLKLIVHVNEEGRKAGDQPHYARQQGPHRHHEDRGAQAGPQRNTSSTRPSAAPAATKKNRAPRSASSRSATSTTAGIPKTSGPSSGTSTTPKSTKAKASASFRSPTGPSSTSGNTSTSKTFRSSRSISPKNGPSSGATA